MGLIPVQVANRGHRILTDENPWALITNPSGAQVAYHVYYPFGEEATAFNQDTERMKFTGHERDLASTAGEGDDLDYMHARFCSPLTGRFLSLDSAPGDSAQPQSWNRYSYALGNPLGYVDPDGAKFRPAFDENRMKREAIGQSLSRIPLIGGIVAWIVDLSIAPYLPVDHADVQAYADSVVLGFGGAVTGTAGQATSFLGRRLENIFLKNLTGATAEAAAKESLGRVVARKATGEAFDHVEKYTTGRLGATQALESLKRLASDQRLANAERAFAEYLLKKYSKQLDAIEKIFQSTLAREAK